MSHDEPRTALLDVVDAARRVDEWMDHRARTEGEGVRAAQLRRSVHAALEKLDFLSTVTPAAPALPSVVDITGVDAIERALLRSLREQVEALPTVLRADKTGLHNSKLVNRAAVLALLADTETAG